MEGLLKKSKILQKIVELFWKNPRWNFWRNLQRIPCRNINQKEYHNKFLGNSWRNSWRTCEVFLKKTLWKPSLEFLAKYIEDFLRNIPEPLTFLIKFLQDFKNVFLEQSMDVILKKLLSKYLGYNTFIIGYNTITKKLCSKFKSTC